MKCITYDRFVDRKCLDTNGSLHQREIAATGVYVTGVSYAPETYCQRKCCMYCIMNNRVRPRQAANLAIEGKAKHSYIMVVQHEQLNTHKDLIGIRECISA